jgi:hypothetical protein
MALVSLVSKAGFAVEDINGVANVIINSDGNVITPDLTVNGLSHLGNIGNVKITGGTDGYVMTTDGTGNLSWAAGGGGGDSGQMPYYIPPGQTYTIQLYRQGLFTIPITIDGDLVVNGILVQV